MTGIPPRFAAQRANGPGWKTVYLDEDQTKAAGVFWGMVRVNPKGYFRLIRLDYNAERSTGGDQAFDWKLITLHDPKKAAAPPVPNTGRNRNRDTPPRKPDRAEKVAIPVRLYLWVAVLGLIAGALLWFLMVGREPVQPKVGFDASGAGPVALSARR